ncbi:MAG: PilN domain-containing protein [Pseudomonadota bacterium]
MSSIVSWAPLSAGVGWWFTELGALLPHNVRVRFAGIGETDRAYWRDGKLEQPQEAATQTPVLSLAPSEVMHHCAKLPLAAEKTLDDVVQFEMDRLTPFAAHDVHFAARVKERLPEQHLLEADVFVIPRAKMKAILDTCYDAGITPQRVDVEDGLGAQGRPLTLYTNAALSMKKALSQRIMPWLIGLAFISGVALAAAHLHGKKNQLETLRTQLEDTRAQVASLSHLKGATRSSADQSALDLKQLTISRVEVLEEITRLLPDDTWLTGLRLQSDDVLLTGMAKDAASLIGVFDGSAFFSSPEFSEPIVQDAQSQRERFSLRLTIDKRPQT